MQIKYLEVKGFKIFDNIKIDFNVEDYGDSLSVLIGQNGSGKSTILEVLLRIFGGFYSNKIAGEYNFDYKIIYLHASREITIIRELKKYNITIVEGGTTVFNSRGALAKFTKLRLDGKLSILPSRLITFYSGNNDKLLPIANILEKNFAKKWNDNTRDYLKVISEDNNRPQYDEVYNELYEKKFIHCDDKQTPIYLIALLCNKNKKDKNVLISELGISGSFKASIKINFRKWKNILFLNNEYSFERFVRIIDFIFDECDGKWNFIDMLHSDKKIITGDNLFWDLTPKYFNGIESIHIYNMLERLSALFDVQINVYCDNVDIAYFSEGQRQLIKLFGMLSLCKNEECLVLMDEPDAHMNPKWKYNIRDYISKAVSGAINTQIIMGTHDPLVINGLKKENIKIFSKQTANTKASINIQEGYDDTSGMGIDALLQSEYYGLKTSYDEETSEKYQRRQSLYIKLINNEISDTEKHELRDLTKELGGLPFSNNTIDFLYDDFIKEYRNSPYYLEDYLTVEQIASRKDEINNIIKKLFED